MKTVSTTSYQNHKIEISEDELRTDAHRFQAAIFNSDGSFTGGYMYNPSEQPSVAQALDAAQKSIDKHITTSKKNAQ